MLKRLLILAIAVFWSLGSLAAVQERADKKPPKKGLADFAAALDEAVYIKDYLNPQPLREFLSVLERRLSRKGSKVPIFLDTSAFDERVRSAAGPRIPPGPGPAPRSGSIADQIIEFSRYNEDPPDKSLPLRILLSGALGQVSSEFPRPAILFRRGHLEITTAELADPKYLLSLRVAGHFVKRPLEEVLDELSEQTGATIVVDVRLGAKARTPVTATFKNTITLEGAVSLLAEMADLDAVVKSDVLFVTVKKKSK